MKRIVLIALMVLVSVNVFAKISPHDRYTEFFNEATLFQMDVTSTLHNYRSEDYTWDGEDFYMEGSSPESAASFLSHQVSCDVLGFDTFSFLLGYATTHLNKKMKEHLDVTINRYDTAFIYDTRRESNNVYGFSIEGTYIDYRVSDIEYHYNDSYENDFVYRDHHRKYYIINFMLYWIGLKQKDFNEYNNFRLGLTTFYGDDMLYPVAMYKNSNVRMEFHNLDALCGGLIGGLTYTKVYSSGFMWLCDLDISIALGRVFNRDRSINNDIAYLKSRFEPGIGYTTGKHFRIFSTFFIDYYNLAFMPTNKPNKAAPKVEGETNKLSTELLDLGLRLGVTVSM